MRELWPPGTVRPGFTPADTPNPRGSIPPPKRDAHRIWQEQRTEARATHPSTAQLSNSQTRGRAIDITSRSRCRQRKAHLPQLFTLANVGRPTNCNFGNHVACYHHWCNHREVYLPLISIFNLECDALNPFKVSGVGPRGLAMGRCLGRKTERCMRKFGHRVYIKSKYKCHFEGLQRRSGPNLKFYRWIHYYCSKTFKYGLLLKV